jgi:hypothetical protein
LSSCIQPFHAYAVGNLGWEPAFEVEAATTAMALRVYKDEPSLPPDAAVGRLRGAITALIQVGSSPPEARFTSRKRLCGFTTPSSMLQSAGRTLPVSS